jgi:stearoyl-CoA desaturase (delta-9 desaturase)
MKESSLEVCRRHCKAGNVDWGMLLYMVVVHIAATVGLWAFMACKWQTRLWCLALWPISGLGITAGAHRLWSHRSYKASLPYRILLMLMFSIANMVSTFFLDFTL